MNLSRCLIPRSRKSAIAYGATFVLLAALAVFAFGGRRGCASHGDVAARVTVVSSGLQQAAAQGKIKVEALAAGIKRMNDAATAYNANTDHTAYCAALDALSEEYKLGK